MAASRSTPGANSFTLRAVVARARLVDRVGLGREPVLLAVQDEHDRAAGLRRA